MKAQVCRDPASIDRNPLTLEDVAQPVVGPADLLVKVHACGVCHTDLHVVEGELRSPKLPIIPGHEVIGEVVQLGRTVKNFAKGDRVGIAWLHQADGTCFFCQQGQENLCPSAKFTGYTVDGGYAEYAVVPSDFATHIPESFSDEDAAPLLCAGVVGYRSLRLVDFKPHDTLGIFGFGASGHLCIQVARHLGCEVYVFTRGAEHQQHARQLGASWTGLASDTPPRPLDRAIIFAPVGEIVPLALRHLRPGGTLCINAIHMSDLPGMAYDLLWQERSIKTVANATRRDAQEFLNIAAEIPVRVTTQIFSLEQANHTLGLLKKGQVRGAAVLNIS